MRELHYHALMLRSTDCYV